MATKPIPPAFIMGQPPDDPGCNLMGYLYMPDPKTFGPGPYPWVVGTRAGGFDEGGPEESNGTLWSFAEAGYMAMFFDVRLVKDSGQGGLVGQTTTGKFPQQGNDFKIGVRYARNHPLCNGFVGAVGGSGSGSHAIRSAIEGTVGDDKTDCAISLSGQLDASDRDADVTVFFIQKVVGYFDSTDLPTLLARSPISEVSTAMSPVYFANGLAENMPYSQFTKFKAALDAAGVTTYLAHTNATNQHSFGTWRENSAGGIGFMNDAYTAWQNGGGGGVLKPEPAGLYDLVPAPAGNWPDLTKKKWPDNPSLSGGRFRTGWVNIQPTDALTFDWSKIDGVISYLAQKGKKLGLSIGSGLCRPDWCPGDRFAPTALDTTDYATDMPIPWKADYLAAWETFVTAFGTRYDADPRLSYVVITGFMQYNEMHLTKNSDDFNSLTTIAVADGYADLRTAYLFAANAVIDMFHAQFPTTRIILTEANPLVGGGLVGNEARQQIHDYGINNYSPHFGWSESSLRATLPPHPGPPVPPLTEPHGEQPLHASDNSDIYVPPPPDPDPIEPQRLEDLLLAGVDGGAKYLEPYESDCESDDPSMQQIIAEVQQILVPGAPPPPPDIPVITSPLTADAIVGQPFSYQITATNDPTDFRELGGDAIGLTVNQQTGILSGTILTAGVYSVTIIAANQFGGDSKALIITATTPFSGARTPILFYPKGGRPPVPKTAPDAPRNVQVQIAGDFGTTTATATWDAPLFDGGSVITSYQPSLTGGGGTVLTDPEALQATLSGLTPDTTYNLSFAAANAYGTGPFSDPAVFTVPPSSAPPPVTDPRGIYTVLYSLANGFPDWQSRTFWDKAYVDGSHYQIGWNVLEPTYDPSATTRTYLLDDLNAYLDQCDTFGKKAIIEITAGILSPQWFLDIEGLASQYSETAPYPGTMVVPWHDKTFLSGMIKDISVALAARTSVIAIIVTGIGQLAETVLSANTTDTDALTRLATRAGFASAADAWISTAERLIPTFNGAFRGGYSLLAPALPVPAGTSVKDGNAALDEVAAFVTGNIRRGKGYVGYQFTSISATTDKPISLVQANSAANVAAGYRFIGPSQFPALDPTQDPASYVPLTGFTNAVNNAVTLKAKFVEIFPEDADSADSGYTTEMANAQTALAANP